MFKNATYAFQEGLKKIVEEGDTIAVRSQEAKELRSHLFKITFPLERVALIPHQNNNIFAQIAETLWLISGHNDIAFLSHYLRYPVDFSGSSKLRTDTYRLRLKNWQGINQIKEVVSILQKDRNSSRAVISLFDPSQDYQDTKDIPCDNWLHFFITDGNLYLNLASIYNDIWWNFPGINTFKWSVLHEMMAYWTTSKVGDYNHFASFFYLDKCHYEKAEKVLAHFPTKTLYDFGFSHPPFSTPIEAFDSTMTEWFAIENQMRQGDTNVLTQINKFDDCFLKNSLQMLYVYNRYVQGAEKQEIAQLLENLPSNDFKIAAIAYFHRQLKDRDFIQLQEKEQDYFNYFWSIENQPQQTEALSASKASQLLLTSPDRSPEATFAAIFAQLCILHQKKSRIYKNSWRKHGELLGVFGNMVRKYDRIETIITEQVTPTTDESLLDTLADMAVYATKYLTYLAEEYQDIFKEFIEQYPPIEPLENYLPNEGFDAVAKILIRRYETTAQWQQMSSYNDCFEAIKNSYKGLEDILIYGDWRSNEPRKCLLTADLAMSSMHYLVLASNKEPEEFKKLLRYIEII